SELRYSPTLYNSHAPTDIYTLSLHDALPISHRPQSSSAAAISRYSQRTTAEGIDPSCRCRGCHKTAQWRPISFENRQEGSIPSRSEEHTSELQSLRHLVCRLLLEKKKKHRSQNMQESEDSLKSTAYITIKN